MTKQLMDNVLKPLKQQMMKGDPINFQTIRYHRSDWVKYKMKPSFPFGMSFERYYDTKVRTPNGRLAFVFLIAE